jgi:acyl-CoA thioester hydrolase
MCVDPTDAVLTHRVRYHETDAQGFLFNSRYLELADVALTEYFRSLGLPYLDLLRAGVDPSVVSAELAFRKPAFFEDVLEVAVTCSRVGRASFTLRMVVTRAEDTVAEMTLTYVNVDPQAKASRPLPGVVGKRLQTDLQERRDKYPVAASGA